MYTVINRRISVGKKLWFLSHMDRRAAVTGQTAYEVGHVLEPLFIDGGVRREAYLIKLADLITILIKACESGGSSEKVLGGVSSSGLDA